MNRIGRGQATGNNFHSEQKLASRISSKSGAPNRFVSIRYWGFNLPEHKADISSPSVAEG